MSRPWKSWPHVSAYIVKIIRASVLYVLEMDTSVKSTYKLLNSFYDHNYQSALFFFQGKAVFPWICLDLNYTKRLTEQSRLQPESTVQLWKWGSFCLSLSLSFQRIWALTSPCVFSLLSVNPAAYFHAAHHFEYFPGTLPGLGDSGRRGISRGGRDEWCRCRDLNASDAMLLQEAFRASFALSSFSHLSALNSSSLLCTVTEAAIL